MKKVFFTVASLLCLTMIVAGTDFGRLTQSKSVSPKRHCVGYTIIEVDKGIDCSGDTVMLTKVHGYYELASANRTNVMSR
jgi:hypothetical protein